MLDLQQYHHPEQASLRHPDQPPFVILNSFQDNEIPLPVILKRVQDDESV
jgi:hypothetical protein